MARPTHGSLRRPLEEVMSAHTWRTTREIADDAGWPIAEARAYLTRMHAYRRVQRGWRGGERTWRAKEAE